VRIADIVQKEPKTWTGQMTVSINKLLITGRSDVYRTTKDRVRGSAQATLLPITSHHTGSLPPSNRL